MEEAEWVIVFVDGDFHRMTPIDTSLAETKTEVRVTFDDRSIFILAICCYVLPRDKIIESLKRDFSFLENDFVKSVSYLYIP